MKEAEDAFSDAQPAEKGPQLNIDEKPFSYLSSVPFDDNLSQNSFGDLQSADSLGTQSFNERMDKMDLKYDAFQEKGYPYPGNLAESEEYKEKCFEQSAQFSSTSWLEEAKKRKRGRRGNPAKGDGKAGRRAHGFYS